MMTSLFRLIHSFPVALCIDRYIMRKVGVIVVFELLGSSGGRVALGYNTVAPPTTAFTGNF